MGFCGPLTRLNPTCMLASLKRGMWMPEACPLCESGVPLTAH